MTATITVDGRQCTVQDQIDCRAWEQIAADPLLREQVEQRLLQRLAAAVMKHLAPAVTVHIPVSPAEAVSAALTRHDADTAPWPGSVSDSN
ncbi:hypothetical protein ABZV52_30035 [Streptomyces sp. NPDC004735]|uniref:hypothetical protein n=1 Tax=Streptomyces sp. NPDC004735 TaxID=3156654 RepID=UPI0033B2EE56